MSERRKCRYRKCDLPLPVTHREDAEYCDELCRSREKNERRRDGASGTRVNPASGRENGERPRLKEPTDCERVLTALRARGKAGIHSHEIRKLFISGNPSQRIADLEAKGYEIEHTSEFKGRRPGTRYVLLAEPGIAGVGTGTERAPSCLPGDSDGAACSPAPSVDPGESGAGGTARPSRKARGAGENPLVGSASPEQSSTGVEGVGVATPRGSLHSGAGEPAALFDLEEARDKPRSAFTDPRAA